MSWTCSSRSDRSTGDRLSRLVGDPCLLEAAEVVDLTRAVLDRAAQPLPTTLGTLDAIHLATALLWRDASPADELVLATHDRSLALAARACGMRTVGI